VPRSNILKHQHYRKSIAFPRAAKIAETGLAGKNLPGRKRRTLIFPTKNRSGQFNSIPAAGVHSNGGQQT
jgi:hypothetical protein